MRRRVIALLLLGPACAPEPTAPAAAPIPTAAAAPPTAAPASSAAPAETAAPAPPPSKPIVVDYKPPNPFHVAASASKEHTFAIFPVNGAVIVPVMKDEQTRTFLVAKGGEIREAPQLLNGLPGVPDRIVGTWPDAMFLASGSAVHAWAHDKWVQLSAKGPYRLARLSGGALGMRVAKGPAVFEVFAVPGATAPAKLSRPPPRGKTCGLIEGADLLGLEGGEIVLAGGVCGTLTMETWQPAYKRWSGTTLDRLVVHDATSFGVLGPSEVLLETIGQSGDGEPYEGTFLVRFQPQGTWKIAATKMRVLGRMVTPALHPFAKETGPMTFSWSTEAREADKRTYVGGLVYRGDDAQAAVLLVDQAVKARVEL